MFALAFALTFATPFAFSNALACALAFALTFALAFALGFAFAKPKRSQNGPKTDPNGRKNAFELGRDGLDRTGSGRIRVGSDFGRLHLQKSYVLPKDFACRSDPELTGTHRNSPQIAAAHLQTLPIC